jgi:hypothetical protein
MNVMSKRRLKKALKPHLSGLGPPQADEILDSRIRVLLIKHSYDLLGEELRDMARTALFQEIKTKIDVQKVTNDIIEVMVDQELRKKTKDFWALEQANRAQLQFIEESLKGRVRQIGQRYFKMISKRLVKKMNSWFFPNFPDSES